MESGNVYDYYITLPHERYRHMYVCYQCKKCDKQFSLHESRSMRRLILHLQRKCEPNFVPNRLPSPPPTSRIIPSFSTEGDKDHVSFEERLEKENPQNTDELLFRLAKLSTCVISDAMAQMKIRGCLVDVGLVRGYAAPSAMNICGPALTVKMIPSTGGTSTLNGSFNYMETAKMGQVVVISAPSGITTAVFGGLLATASKARRCTVCTDPQPLQKSIALSSLQGV